MDRSTRFAKWSNFFTHLTIVFNFLCSPLIEKLADWNDDNRIGTNLSLREDLYSWALVTCINRDYLAQLLFFKKREAEKQKKEDELVDAKNWLEETRRITDEATSNNEGDFSYSVTYHEKRVA